MTEEGLDISGVRILDRNGQRFGELVEDARDLPLSASKASFLYALTTCHSLKVVSGDPIGDPLDMKMFSFTDWTLEEGDVSKKAALSKDPKQNGERSAALVQFVVRPPGTARFRLEDAMKSGKRVSRLLNGDAS